jgi:hypothetical protein
MARTSLPFVERQYRPDTRRLGDLMAQRRQDAIDARLREADINSRMVTGLAGAIGGTLSDIVNIQAQAPARKAAAEKQRREADAATRAENVNRIVDDTARLGLPKSQVADQMAQFGFGRESEAMRAEATKERQSLVSQSLASINARLDIMGQAEETAQQIERRPDLYPEFRGRLTDLANTLDPTGEVAKQIPVDLPTPEAARELSANIRSLAETARKQATDLRKVDAATKALTTAADITKAKAELKRSVAELLLDAPTPEMRTNIVENLRDDPGMDVSVLDSLAGLDSNGLAEAMKTSAQRATDARKTDAPLDRQLADALEAGDQKKVRTIREAIRMASDAGRAPKDATAELAGNRITKKDLDEADEWKVNALRQAEAEFRQATAPYRERTTDYGVVPAREIPPDVVAAHEARKADIERVYRGKRGLAPTIRDAVTRSTTPPPAQPPARAATPSPSIVPPPTRTGSPLGSGTATAAPTRVPPKVGDTVTVRGQRVRITRILPNGQIEGVPVP